MGGGGGGGGGWHLCASHVCCKGKSNGCEKVTLEYLIPSGRRLVDPLSKVSHCPPDAKLALAQPILGPHIWTPSKDTVN